MKKILYVMKEELEKTEFGETKKYNVYMKNGNEETFDCSFGIKEKAEKYVEAMNM